MVVPVKIKDDAEDSKETDVQDLVQDLVHAQDQDPVQDHLIENVKYFFSYYQLKKNLNF